MATATKSRSTKKSKGQTSSSRKSASTTSSAGTERTSSPSSAERLARDWPKKGGNDVQPWDNRALKIDTTDVGAEPNTLSPIVVQHDKSTITAGSGGADVRELGRLLGELGYETSFSRGENPFSIADRSVMDAVAAFTRDYDVQEDPTAFGGDNPSGRELASNHVGPWTWEAILRVHERESD